MLLFCKVVPNLFFYEFFGLVVCINPGTNTFSSILFSRFWLYTSSLIMLILKSPIIRWLLVFLFLLMYGFKFASSRLGRSWHLYNDDISSILLLFSVIRVFNNYNKYCISNVSLISLTLSFISTTTPSF